MDLESRRLWEEYTKAKETMIERTHTPESPWYGRTKAEVWFNSTEAAEAAGFVPAVANNNEEKDK